VGFWARVAAALIDTVMLLVVTAPLSFLVYGSVMGPGGLAFRGAADLLIQWALPAAIIILLWSRLQATPGKLVVGARIVDADSGEAPSTAQLLIRYVGYFVSSIPLGLGLLWVGIDRRKQGWHDKMANTVVIRRSNKEPVAFQPTRIS